MVLLRGDGSLALGSDPQKEKSLVSCERVKQAVNSILPQNPFVPRSPPAKFNTLPQESGRHPEGICHVFLCVVFSSRLLGRLYTFGALHLSVHAKKKEQTSRFTTQTKSIVVYAPLFVTERQPCTCSRRSPVCRRATWSQSHASETSETNKTGRVAFESTEEEGGAHRYQQKRSILTHG